MGVAGSYYVRVTNSSGCEGVSTRVTVTVASSTLASISSSSATNSFCAGQSITLTASAGMSYLWLPTLSTSRTITVSTAGTYTVNVLNANNTTSTATITVSQAASPGLPQISYSYAPSAYQLTAFEPTALGYSWSNGQASANIQVAAPGTYSVRAINASGCISQPSSMQVNSVQVRSCVKPDMLSANNIINNQALLSWNPAITADSFKVSYTKFGTSITFHKYVKNTNYLLVKELSVASIYSWTVTAICASGQYVSSVSKFTTLSGPTGCGSTTLNTNTINISNTSAQLSWFGTTASTITIRYRKAGLTAYTYVTLNTSSSAVWGYLLNNLSPNTTYQWAAKTGCGNVASAYCNNISFTTTSSCPVPDVAVMSNIKATSADVKWIPSSLASTMYIRYAVSGTTNYAYASCSASSGSFTIKNLKGGTRYQIWLRSGCSQSTYSTYNAPATFATAVIRLGDEEESALQLNAFPNPASNRITYVFKTEKSGDYHVKVCDMSGRELIQEIRQAEAGVNSAELDLTKFSPGMYLITIKQRGQQSYLRFQVQR